MRILVLFAAAATLSAAPLPAKSGFEAMKKLEGSWTQTNPDGSMTYLTLSVISGGSAILETMTGKDRSKVAMSSVYHLDGDELVMTHYCGQGNQPRMRARLIEKNRIRFDAYEVMNLKSPNHGHMSSVTFIFKDSDTLTQQWTNKEGGKESKIVFDLKREYVDTLK